VQAFTEGDVTKATPLSDIFSRPHATVMHFAATPDEAHAVTETLGKITTSHYFPDSVILRGLEFLQTAKSFPNGQGSCGVVWYGVEKTGALVDFQKRIADGILGIIGGENNPLITGVGDRWAPHFTLMVTNKSFSGSSVLLPERNLPAFGSSTPVRLALCDSGPIGQVHKVFWVAPSP
jgi:2'-5' RNA ligase